MSGHHIDIARIGNPEAFRLASGSAGTVLDLTTDRVEAADADEPLVVCLRVVP